MTSPQAASERPELQPCPFCSGAAHRRELIEHYPASADGPAGSYTAWFHIGCDVCGIEVGDEYESTAAAAWNRRASVSATADSAMEEAEQAIIARALAWYEASSKGVPAHDLALAVLRYRKLQERTDRG